MTEREFWLTLEYRLEPEFQGMADRYLQYLWCDGFTPTQYFLDQNPPRIVGRAWICNGPMREEWDFTLFLPAPATAVELIDWRSLLPPLNVTRWLAVDRDRKRIEIEPGAAVPDLSQN
jgi:hypothetical protein